jgi:hypothetical protein
LNADDETSNIGSGLAINGRYKDVYIYENVAKARESFDSGRPISCVMLSNKSYWIMIKDSTMLEIKPSIEPVCTLCGAAYFRWVIVTRNEPETYTPRYMM